MNKTRKNIVICGFNELENRSIDPAIINKNYYVDTVEEAKKHQGYLLIINNKEHLSLINFDKKYRKSLLKKYEWIIMFDDKIKINRPKDKFSNIEIMNSETLFSGLFDFIWFYYEKYRKEVESLEKNKYTNKRLNYIHMIKDYIKNKKTIKTEELSKYFNMSNRNIERYMTDINNIYKNIGYDYSNNEWYIL